VRSLERQLRAERSQLNTFWTLRDAIHFKPFNFSAGDRKAILSEIRPTPTKDSEDSLIASLEGAIALFKAWSVFETNRAPQSEARKELKVFLGRTRRLQEAAASLDWSTRRTLAPPYRGKESPSLPLLKTRKPDEMSILDDDLCDAFAILANVADTISVYLEKTSPSKGGRRALRARDVLAVEIADTLEEHVRGSVLITAVAGNPFENIFSLCLQAATGAAIGDLHRIVSRGVKAFQSADRTAEIRKPQKLR